jgi:hypothetical protein
VIAERSQKVTDDRATWTARKRDRASIRDAILRYFWGADRGDQTLHQSAFAPDGKLFIDGVQRRGPGAPPPDQLPQPKGVALDEVVATTHHLHQSDIRFVDDGAGDAPAVALVESYATAYVLVETGGERRLLVRGLRYLDRFERRDQQWLIAERRHNVDWMYEAMPSMAVTRSDRVSFDDWCTAESASARQPARRE